MTEKIDGWLSIPAMAASAAARHGDHRAIVDGDVELTYDDVDAGRTFGAALVVSGIAAGDRVAIWCFNSVEWVVAALGIWEAGAVLVPINTRFKGNEAADILGRSRVRALVTVTDFLGADYVAMLAEARDELPHLETIVVARGPVPADAIGWDDFLASATTDARAEVQGRSAALGPDDPSDILFTSGTTGSPKGVVQTHSRTLRVASDWAAMTGLSPADRYLMVNPYFHMFGLKAGILASIAGGATMLPQAVFDVEAVLGRVNDERVTVLPGAPTIYHAILEHPGRSKYDLTSLRVAVTGAADIPVELIGRVLAELPFSMVVTGYGLTEGGTATATSPDDDAETIATTVGRPRPGFELRIIDGNGGELPVGEAGEIELRSPTVMKEYLDDPEATAEVLGSDGWLRTGDLGVVDERGNVRIVGRSKDMYIVGGFNAYPAEIENLLLRHPDIDQVAVVGIPDARLGEVGVAFVVRRADASTTGDEIIAWARGEMANYKVPRSVEIVDGLPVNATGKVLKTELRERDAATGMIRGQAAIAGIGEVAPRRDTGEETTVDLLSRVADLTVRDAGVALHDVDGLVVHQVHGMSMGAVVLVELLGLRVSFVDRVDHGGATGAAMVARAAMAVATGACTTCLCITASARRAGAPGPRIADLSPTAEFEEPYGGVGANYGYAMIARRYMHEYGATPEQLAAVAVQHRANACANPDAIFHGQPITIDDVLTSPVVVDPLHLLEIVMPTGGAAGVLVTTPERARDLQHLPVPILGVGEHVSHWSATYAPNLTSSSVKPAADRAFAMAGVSRADVGLLSVYDCYTITVLLTLEDAGFCPKGEAGRFVEENDLRWDGNLPTNTHGGQLSYGQSGIAGGMSHVTEAVRQLQGRAAGRTVDGLELAFVHGNGGVMGEQVSLVLGAGP